MTQTAVTDGKAVHLMPAIDTMLHACNEKCPCKPSRDDSASKPVYTHHMRAVANR